MKLSFCVGKVRYNVWMSKTSEVPADQRNTSCVCFQSSGPHGLSSYFAETHAITCKLCKYSSTEVVLRHLQWWSRRDLNQQKRAETAEAIIWNEESNVNRRVSSVVLNWFSLRQEAPRPLCPGPHGVETLVLAACETLCDSGGETGWCRSPRERNPVMGRQKKLFTQYIQTNLFIGVLCHKVPQSCLTQYKLWLSFSWAQLPTIWFFFSADYRNNQKILPSVPEKICLSLLFHFWSLPTTYQLIPRVKVDHKQQGGFM